LKGEERLGCDFCTFSR